MQAAATSAGLKWHQAQKTMSIAMYTCEQRKVKKGHVYCKVRVQVASKSAGLKWHQVQKITFIAKSTCELRKAEKIAY